MYVLWLFTKLADAGSLLVSGIEDKTVTLTAAKSRSTGSTTRLQRGNFATGYWRSFQPKLLSLDSS
ncbi:hypothetical protein [Paenibacillus silvestris]|uniref:hypothetical protein n=1 Tax=Paenibacillus silvestris TaxID=2606219 RepID=UPI001F1AFC2F|nr:hypothetical protein [Paenibacillus silvestris]